MFNNELKKKVKILEKEVKYMKNFMHDLYIELQTYKDLNKENTRQIRILNDKRFK